MNIETFLNKYPSLENKKIIITGANSGVGFECARHILKKNGSLVMACRNIARANAAKEKLILEFPNSEVSILIYDQSSIESTRNLAKDIITNHNDFFAILLNAGIYHPETNSKTIDGYSLTIATNFLANYAFLEEMESFLSLATEERRIIFQGSLASRLSINKRNINANFKSKFQEYALSKYALENLFYMSYLNNKNPNVKYLLVEPGITNTNIINGFPKLFQKVGKAFLKTFMMSPSKASLCSFVAIGGDVRSGESYLPSGLFRISGFPKRFKMKKRYISNRYNIEAKEILNG